MYANINPFFYVVVLHFAVTRRAKALYYLGAFCLDQSFKNAAKILYHEPRPYMVDDQIIPISCSESFGTPSGHMITATLFTATTFLDYLHGEGLKEKMSKPVYFLISVASLAFVLTMGYCRVYLAVHSIDQVFFGFQLGLWMSSYYHFGFRQQLLAHVDQLVSEPSTEHH